MAEKFLRFSIGLVLIVGVVGLVPSSRVAAWGVTSDYRTIDSRSLNAAGVICWNNLATNPKTVSIEARDVLLKHASGYSEQTTSVQYLLYQELSGGKLNLVDRSPLVMATTEASGWAAFGPYTFENRGIGPRYVVVVDMVWYDDAANPAGGRQVRLQNYEVRNHYPNDTSNSSVTVQSACISPVPPSVSISASEGTAQSPLNFSIRYFPSRVTAFIRWDGSQSIGSITTTTAGGASGIVQIPAAPMGAHTLKWQYDNWAATTTYTVKPRIKVIEGTVKRGQTVNVSLRGFAAKEVVRIRWQKGTSWVELGRITTSSTGSANAYVKVPLWAPNGLASVRGDGTYGRAQTNAVYVLGGALLSSSAVKTPTPTPKATATSTATATATPATPEATETVSPVAETATASDTATPEPSPSVTDEPTDEASSPTPTATPTIEPIAVPSETAVATATEDAG
jgi:hypothetical protein